MKSCLYQLNSITNPNRKKEEVEGTRNGKRWYNMIRGEGKANKTRGERRCGVRGSFEGLKERVERMAKGNCFLDTRKEMLCRREFAWCLMLAVRYFWQGQDGQGVKIIYIFQRSIEISHQLAGLNVISTLQTGIFIYSTVLHFVLHYDVAPKSCREI